ncbi:hypothetical protein N7460_013587 [Penicillium canescens]|uniref:HMG box domain-containing protein n=1 Tax=Penicillium canescens TaxID=5083 RepID=A0AAD6I081_PENCN|nr:hypothetical protein N7460_013587 [Penicillium canescens]
MPNVVTRELLKQSWSISHSSYSKPQSTSTIYHALAVRSSGALLRPLHFSASTRPNAIIGVQNQLRHLCLAANVRQAQPRLQRIPAVLLLSQSKSFATDTSPKPKKTKAKTDNRKPAKNSSTKKKPLTEKQKEAKELRQHKDHIKQLKQTALEVPKGLLENYFFIALHEKINEIKGQYPTQREAVQAAAEMLKPVPNEAKYRAQAEENKAANKASYEDWLNSHTPLQIKKANIARLSLTRIEGKPHSKRWTLIQDERLVRRPSSAYTFYCTEGLKSSDNQHMPVRERISVIAGEWKAMSEAEKEPYHKMSIEDRARYEREHQEVYGTPAPLSKSKAEASS